MVDFSNAKLCGASPEMNDVFAKLEAAADEINNKIEASASEAAAKFKEMQNELNLVTEKLQNIEIPELPQLNLPAEISGLIGMATGSSAHASALGKLTSEFSSVVSAKGLSMDSLIGAAKSGDVCSLIPNLQKVSGSDTTVQKPKEVLQAAKEALGEAASKITQNTELKSKMEALAQRVSAGDVSNKQPEKDGGSIKYAKPTNIKSIAAPSGVTTKAVVQKVTNASDRGNVVKDGQGDGFSYKKKRIVQSFSVSGEKGTKLELDGDYVHLYLKHKPVGKISVLMYPGGVVPPFYGGEHLKLPGGAHHPAWAMHDDSKWYASYWGRHIVYIIRAGEVSAQTNYSVFGSILRFYAPLPVADHPGNINSGGSFHGPDTFLVWGKYGDWMVKQWKYGWGKKKDSKYNKKMAGIAVKAMYDTLDNYDPDYKPASESDSG